MEIQKPYLLFLGDAHDVLAAKVAIGIKQWHPEYCVGQYRMDDWALFPLRVGEYFHSTR